MPGLPLRADGGIVDLAAQCSLIIGCPARADPPSERERTRRQCCERFAKLRSMATRRGFLQTTGAATLALASPPAVGETVAQTAPLPSEHVSLTINGRRYALDLDPRTTLLDALREHFALTGSKKGCDQGQCGACTIIVNGQRINSCLALAVMH